MPTKHLKGSFKKEKYMVLAGIKHNPITTLMFSILSLLSVDDLLVPHICSSFSYLHFFYLL
ncbi:hypothetical protein Fmac_013141 [Flemingia macrophylla]|uniref:Uncharacterized protein n=1 Tax=Flemingia macrophylla TaxID=520843 RepID=A0ABD1MSC4_9FABA